MSDEDGFLNNLLENPADDTVRLIYADWLDDRGTEEAARKAQFLRVQCEIQAKRRRKKGFRQLHAKLAELARHLPTDWLAVVSHLAIENCRANPPKRVGLSVIYVTPPPRFDYECPKEWSSLTATDDPAVRHCDACDQKVFYSDTIQVARQHALRGRCVAIDCAIPRKDRDLEPPRRRMGRMLPTAVNRTRRLEGERVIPDDVSVERERSKGHRNPDRTGFEGRSRW